MFSIRIFWEFLATKKGFIIKPESFELFNVTREGHEDIFVEVDAFRELTSIPEITFILDRLEIQGECLHMDFKTFLGLNYPELYR